MDVKSSSYINHGLGNLSRLPLEIRLEIWDYFSLDVQYSTLPWVSKRDQPNQYSFLRTSRTIYIEASDFVYRNAVLTFISGMWNFRYCWMEMTLTSGYSMEFKDLRDAYRKGFGRLPLSKFKKIQVDIVAPNPRDPGSLLIIWLQNVHIAELLAIGEHASAAITIDLLEETDQAWEAAEPDPQGRRRASNTLADNEFDYPNRPPGILRPDFAVVLIPFRRLRNFESAEVLYPEWLADEAKGFIHDLLWLMTREELFGEYCDPQDAARSDQTIQQDFENELEYLCTGLRRFFGGITVLRMKKLDFEYPMKSFTRLDNKDGSWITCTYNNARMGIKDTSENVSAWIWKGSAGFRTW